MIDSDLKQRCIDLEHFETPWWAALKILQHELLTHRVEDPAAGTGVLVIAALRAGYDAHGRDIHDFTNLAEGDFELDALEDFLERTDPFPDDTTVFMNPPFSKAREFVLHAMKLGARKILCFQRFAWLESQERREFWDTHPPARVYICGDRASCWRHDIPLDQRKSSTPTAHGFFVWEKGHGSGTQMLRMYKDQPE